MENKGFITPAVAGILGTGYVESRLHMDGKFSAEKTAEQKALESRYSGTQTRPTYVIIDPMTGDQIGEKFQLLSASFDAEFERFANWLKDAHEPWAAKREAEREEKAKTASAR